MKNLLIALAAVALGLTVLPPYLAYAGKLEAPALKGLMFAGTILWFVAAVPLANLRDRGRSRST